MATRIDMDFVDAAVMGGLVLSAGGSGMARVARNRRIGALALDYGPLHLVGLDELDANAPIIVGTGVGAPGHAKAIVSLRDAARAAELLIQANPGLRPAGVMPGHVPGMNAWVTAAILGLPLVDAATNGRGHPTVKMGGMGLSSRSDFAITQAGAGGDDNDRLEIVVRGNLTKTSTVMRAASVQNGGLIAAVRGPFDVALVRSGGAPGAMSFSVRLGRAMLSVPAGRARIKVAAEVLGGEIVVEGKVEENTVRYEDGFDVGRIVVNGNAGRIALHVYNEFMAASSGEQRLWTFPDMMASFDPASGDPVAISELPVGRDVTIVAGPQSAFPVGASARDPSVFPEVEQKLGISLTP